MRNQNTAIVTALLSIGITSTGFLYNQYKKGNLTMSLKKGFLCVEGRIKGQPLRFSVPLPDASKIFDTLSNFNNQYLKR